MAMRITTKMMQNTSLRNLNINKARQEMLTNQMSTGKNITRPSDDPVIAIRALKLNSSLDKIDQYYEKNAADAASWLELTDAAIATVNGILSNDIKANINQICNSYMKVKDREAVILSLTNAVKEIYSTGNADSAGRSLFTGYRTDMPLTMKSDKFEKNVITEQLTNAAIDKKTFVRTGNLKSINEGNFMSQDTTEYKVSTDDIYRIRLAYGEVDIEVAERDKDGKPTKYESNIDIGFMSDAKVQGNSAQISTGSVSAYVSVDVNKVPAEAVFNVNGQEYRMVKGETIDSTTTLPGGATNSLPTGVTLSYGEDGTFKIINTNMVPNETASIGSNITKDSSGKSVVTFDEKFKTSLAISNYYPSGSDDNAYLSVVGENNADKITYIADTGELLLGENIKKRLSELPSDTELRVTYEKSNWKENDLDPVHYFYTERTTKSSSGKDKTIKYNENFLVDPSANGKQIIEYDVGNNQSLRVNTTADEVFTHDIGRDMEEVVEMLKEYGSLEESLNTVESMIKSEKYDGDELKRLEEQKAALGEAMTRVGDKINKRCQALIKDGDNYFERAQLAETDCGSRESRLRLIQNRLSMQQTNFGELVSENEDADYTDLVIQLKSIEMTYNAALSSISYVMQTSLLDFVR
jgi:flagellar hook-associated protein 3 FlgL